VVPVIPKEIERVSRIVAELGAQEFGPTVDAFLRDNAAFDMTCIFAFHRTSPPLLIHDGYSASVSRIALSSYLKGAYLLDPFYIACTTAVHDGLWRMSDIAPDEFFASDFAGSHEVHPCISDESGTLVEEIGYIVTLADGWRATYSLMRNCTSKPFSEDEFETLSELAPFLGALVQRHSELASVTSTQPRAAEVDSVLQKAFSDQLTPAQFRVVNLILRGHSNQSVAKELHITEGTAKLHRHNAYQRLGVTSQSDLFRVFIDFLEED
jgi:DNA-binding CsgD family transcriptional regulator